jgi:hypothetical protein
MLVSCATAQRKCILAQQAPLGILCLQGEQEAHDGTSQGRILGSWTAILGADPSTFCLLVHFCATPCWGVLDQLHLLSLVIFGDLFALRMNNGCP